MTDDEEPLSLAQEVTIFLTAELMARGEFVPIYTEWPRPEV